MTETEWLAAIEPAPMLEFLRGKASDRKWRLFAVACCRRVWRYLSDSRSRDAISRAEDYADGKQTLERLEEAEAAAWEAANHRHESEYLASKGAAWTTQRDAGLAAEGASESTFGATVCDPDDPEEEDVYQTAILRCVFGPLPFRPVAVNPAWLTSTAVALAARMYESRDFGPMPILADALQDAGCDDTEVLDHCRGDGPHVWGCWVVDLILGKE